MLTHNRDQNGAKLLLFRGIAFERRGDLYAALDCYREALSQTAVGTDIHQELTQILTSLQGRLAQPGARGPHYDAGTMGDPEPEAHEVMRCHELYKASYRRSDWKSAQQALELLLRYRPFFVQDQRPAWKLLEEVRIRASTPESAKGMPVWGWIGLVCLFVLTGVVVYQNFGFRTRLGTVGGPNRNRNQNQNYPPPQNQQYPPPGQQYQQPPVQAQQPPPPPIAQPPVAPPTPASGGSRIVLNLPKSVPVGKQLKLIQQVIGTSSTLRLQWSAERGAIIEMQGEMFWRPPPDAKVGEHMVLTVQAQDASGRLSAPMQHEVTITKP